jgi:hypothetical protein
VSIDYTVDALIDKIKRRGSIPTSQGLFLSSDFVDILSDSLIQTIVPAITSVREEYFVISKDEDIVSGQSEYKIPSRAVGGMLRDVVIVNDAGTEISIQRLEPETLKSSNTWLTQNRYGFKVKGDSIVLIPTPTQTQDSIRFYYERRPNNLVLQSSAATITEINTGTNQITLDQTPSTFSTSETYDIIGNNPIFPSYGDDIAITTLSSNIMTLSDDIPDDVAVGQWVSLSCFSPVPQIPYEAHLWLAHEALSVCLEAQTDQPGLANAKKQCEMHRANFLKIITPRVHGSPQKITNRNGIMSYSRVGGRWTR